MQALCINQQNFLDKFMNANASDIVKEENIKLTTLDAVSGAKRKLDFLKVDVEGADLEVIRGGEKSLSDCLGIKNWKFNTKKEYRVTFIF